MNRRELPDEERCTADTRDGGRCKLAREPGDNLCFRHSATGELPDEERCTGLISGGYDHQDRRGERCRNRRMVGLPVCRMHGANKTAREIGRIRRAEEELMAQASRLVGTPVENPLTELAALAGRARALMDVLEARVEALLDAPDESGEYTETGGIRYKGGAGEQIRGEVQLYERSMDRLGKMLVDIGRLNIDERLAKLEERQIELVISALEVGLNAAGVRDPQQRETAKTAAGRHLRAVGS